jgi:ribose transport system substrate-binding protein
VRILLEGVENMKTSKKTRPAFRTAGLSMLVAAAALGQARADTLNLTDAEKTPAKCDVNYKVGDLGGFKAPKAKKPYKIEFSVPMYIPYIQGLIYGAQLAAKDAGVTLTVDAGQGFMNSAAQITQLENAMTRKPDAVLINPSDPDGMAPTIDDALANRTVVFDVGTLSASEKSNKLVQDDVYQGQIGADAIAKLMPQGGQGIVMAGPPNASWARRRVAGFLDQIKKHPNIKILEVVSSDNDASDGVTKFSNAAEKNPKIDWIYVTGSFVLQPQSIPAEYKKAIYVAGSLTNVTLEALKDGSAAAILPDFPVSVGYLGLSLAVKKLNGETVPQYNCAPTDAMYKAEANSPVWVDSSLPPADWAPPK